MTENEKMLLRQKIHSNRHEICVISMEEMYLRIDGFLQGVKDEGVWKTFRGITGFGASWGVLGKDLVSLTKLIGDLGGAGKFYIKEYGGKSHIILKGYPGLRKILTGTKYGVANPTVVTMGLGKAGVAYSAKNGGLFSVLLISVYRVVDYALSDNQTLSRLIGTLSTDVAKVAIATAAGYVAGTFVAGITVVAVGPIVAAIAVGALVSWGLGKLDEHYGITEKVIKKLGEMNDDFDSSLYEFKRDWNYLQNHPEEILCLFAPCDGFNFYDQF